MSTNIQGEIFSSAVATMHLISLVLSNEAELMETLVKRIDQTL